MSISGVNSGLSLHNQNSPHNFRKLPNPFSNEKTNMSSIVNISETGKGLSREIELDFNNPEIIALLETHGLPDWYADLLPKEAVIELAPMGTPLRESTHYTHTGINKREIVYCNTLLSNIFTEESLTAGVSSAERYYMKTSEPEKFLEYDEKLHQAVKDRLLEDNLYMKYMELLGIPV